MHTTYSYGINQTLNGKIDPDRLEKEIIHSEAYGFGVFHVVYHDIVVAGDDVHVVFKDGLTAEDKTVLDTVIAQHAGEALRPPALVELDALQESDKRIAVVATPVEHGWASWMTGAGDDLEEKIRGGGDDFYLEFEGPGEKVIEVKFFEPVQLHAGEVLWGGTGWSPKDKFDVQVFIPGNKIGGSLSNASGDGNVHVMPYAPGVNVIIPASGDGNYSIDLTKATPLYAYNNGYWKMDITTGEIFPAPKGDGEWNLVDVDTHPAFAKGISMGYSDCKKTVESHKTKILHPGHSLHLKVKKSSEGFGWASAVLHAFRINTL